MDNKPRKPLYDYEADGTKKTPSRGVPPLDALPTRGGQEDGGPEILASHTAQSRQRPQGGGGSRGTGTVHTSKATAERKRKKRRNRRIVIVAVCLVVALLAGGVIWAYNAIFGGIRGEVTDAGSIPDEVRTETIPEYSGKDIICGLIMGIDYDNEGADGYTDPTNKIGNTDMLMYLMYNTKTDQANILQIPRDAFVGKEVETNGICKINSLYRYSEDSENRVQALAKVLYDQYQLPTDFYITIDMDAVKAIVAHMQFIQVYVPQDIVDGETGTRLLNEGWQNITEREIEFLVRNRNYADGDITRLRTQQSLYSALFREFKRLAPGDLMMWMRILMHYCKIGGISDMQILGLAQEALSLTSENLTFVRPPYWGSWFTPEKGPLEGMRQSYVSLDPAGTAEILNQYFRPDGHTIGEDELNIYTLPENEFGSAPAEIKTMASVQETEPEMPPPY